MLLYLIALFSFGAVSLLIIGFTMKSERVIIQERMQKHSMAGSISASSIELELAAPFKQRILLPFLRKLASLAIRFTPGAGYRILEEKLETAGRPWGLGAKEFIGLRVLSLAVFIVLGILAARFINGTPLIKLAILFILLFIGAILPSYLLQDATNKRQAKIRKVLADTLDMLTVSMEAGLSLDEAILKVVEKVKGPLSEELGRALHEMQIGKLRVEALRDMAKRAKVAELTGFVAAVCQADQLGVSIVKVLRVQGETLRHQRSQRARETAAKIPVKMLFPLVMFIFPSIFVVVLGPAALRIGRAFGMIQ